MLNDSIKLHFTQSCDLPIILVFSIGWFDIVRRSKSKETEISKISHIDATGENNVYKF